ncbi:gamma-glutamyltranspeptidase [Hymenopellis radicata]|nr:gamma-glutamyltranspeptidase [Hymenopellis radicata]
MPKSNLGAVACESTIAARILEDAQMPSSRRSSLWALWMGIGGGGFALVRTGLEAVHGKYGRLPWARVVEPAVKLARDGFPWVEDHLRIVKKNLPPGSTDLADSWIHTHPVLSKMFTRNGEFVPFEFADTLQTIAEHGVDAFCTGPIAQSMVDAANAEGGKLTLDDFKSFEVKYTKPRSINYKGFKVTAPCAPASGAVVLLALSVLSNFTDSDGPVSVNDTHRLIEAMKWAYAHRTMLGDPRFVAGLEEKQERWVDPALGKRLAEGIDEGKTFPVEHYNADGIEVKDDHGTSHVIVGDADGLVIAVTTTVTLMWGSRIIVPSTGIVLNDNMEDFSVEGRPNYFGIRPQVSNYIVGGKRPLSSTSPRIVSCNIQHARNVLVSKRTSASLLLTPSRTTLRRAQLHDQLLPNETHLEPLHDEALRQRGHKTKRISGTSSSRATSTACGVAYDPERDVWQAAGEPRIFNAGCGCVGTGYKA